MLLKGPGFPAGDRTARRVPELGQLPLTSHRTAQWPPSGAGTPHRGVRPLLVGSQERKVYIGLCPWVSLIQAPASAFVAPVHSWPPPPLGSLRVSPPVMMPSAQQHPAQARWQAQREAREQGVWHLRPFR